MHAPAFWYQKPSLLSALLRPFSWLYGAGAWIARHISAAATVSVPVICIGNCVVGGAGKTPVTADFARRLKAAGRNVHILSRGHGGRLYGPVKVDPAQHTAADVGDEPLLLAALAPVWVSKNKVAGAVAAIADGADMILMDDGLQNMSLRKTISYLVIDGERGFGNGALLPAGPLREPPGAALARCAGVIWLGADAPLRALLAAKRPVYTGIPHTVSLGVSLAGEKIFAFCGIAHPQKFYAGLKKTGAEIVATEDFPDHHPWQDADIKMLLEKAKALSAIPVTTAKDAMRIPPGLRNGITICDVTIAWQGAAPPAQA